jgi:uncharacterized SAM-binding protein YcdF (DUF218 family)
MNEKKISLHKGGHCCFLATSAAALPILVLILLFLGELILMVVGGVLIIADPIREVDTIIVLSGGGDLSRVGEGALLYNEKLAPWLVFTETDPLNGELISDTMALLKEEARSLGVPDSAILITPGHAESTLDEARQSLQLMQTNGFTGCIVVTDPFHTLRTRLIFRDVYRKSGITVSVRPVRNHWYRSTTWWASVEGRQATLNEYLKIAAYLLGQQAGVFE